MALSRMVPHLICLGAIIAGVPSLGCSGSRLARPQSSEGDAARTNESAVVATHPPPAALPEIVSERPSDRAQWLAGTWVWEGNSWVWERGGWIENPESLRLVDSQVRYAKDGTLEFCPRRWVNAEGDETAQSPPIVEPAATPPTTELREENTVP
jgi:hypothetical protein